MKLQKLYFDRCYDQWKGLDIAIEEEMNGSNEVDGYGLYIQVPDINMVDDGTIYTINASFEGIEEPANGEVYNAEKRIIRIEMPPQILANDGLYKATFTISMKKDEETIVKNTAMQTFTILETIEISDEYIESYDKYSLLAELLKNATDTEIDTSSFAKIEYVDKLVEEALNGVNLDNIIAELESKGIYVNKDEFNTALSIYITKHDAAQFAKASDLNSYAKSSWVMNNYATQSLLNSSLKNYVLKETGKVLSSNDFTNALRDKLINIPDDGSDYDDTELRELIDKKVDFSTFEQWIKNSVNSEDYYDKTSVDKMVNDVYSIHEEDIQNIENELPSFLKKEDYQYSDGINTDDVKTIDGLNLSDILNDIIAKVNYKEIEIESFESTLIKHIYQFQVDKLESVTLRWKLNKTPISQTISNYEGALSVENREVTINKTINKDIDFTLTVTDENGIEKSKTVSIRFIQASYYGVYEGDLTEEKIKAGNKIIILNENQTVDMVYEDKKVFFAYPKIFGELVDIKDGNGLSYFGDFTLDSTWGFNGTSYYVYKLEDEASVNSITFSFIFAKEGEQINDNRY